MAMPRARRVAKMKQQPYFKAWIRDGKFDLSCVSQLASFVEVRMFVDIDNAPYRVEL